MIFFHDMNKTNNGNLKFFYEQKNEEYRTNEFYITKEM